MAEPRVSTTRLRKALDTLERRLPWRAFSVDEAEAALGLSKRTVSLILAGLTDQGMIARTGRGTYSRLPKPTLIPDPKTLPSASKRLHKALTTEGIQFALSCLDVLAGYTHLALRQYPHFSWVASGSEDWAAEAAERAGFLPIREPKRPQVPLALDLAGDRNPLILRKTSIFYATVEGLATVERALVDLHYEVTRERYPLDGAELLRIFYYVLTSVSADFPKMLRYAGLRRLKQEILWILRQFGERIDIPEAYLDPSVRPTKFVLKLPTVDEAMAR
ncbi:MAG: hypothetical protein AB1449_05825 [Chloroflexota bacterium]